MKTLLKVISQTIQALTRAAGFLLMPFWRGISGAITVLVLFGLVAMGLLFVFSPLLPPSGGILNPDGGLLKVHENTRISVRESLLNKSNLQRLRTGQQPINAPRGKPVAVLQFNGEKGANPALFASLIDEVIVNQAAFDEVVVIVNSGGGPVGLYGQLYADMLRIKQNTRLPLIVCVDQVAASGGYMMILPADKIIAAPLATIGSIGVVSESLNFHDLMKKVGVQDVTLTAGKFKRPLTATGEVTEEGKQHQREKLASIHAQFIKLVTKHRKDVDPDKACNADIWTAQESVDLKLGLVDALATSHEVLLSLNLQHDLIILENSGRAGLQGLLDSSVEAAADKVADRVEMHLLGSSTNQPLLSGAK